MASMDPTAHTRQSAVDLAEGLARTLRIAEALHTARRHIDLAGLDDLVGRLCARALDLPPEQGRTLRPSLVALCEQADRFADTLRATPPDHAPPGHAPRDPVPRGGRTPGTPPPDH
ncbi:hypothetical protein [Acidisphaera rubrifaciens]|uniref:Uncharacterized protein n=1 Tax=Acidisphaera rubrifaciens HS-AP3 TaxID=1231350 RepID=A0A0D6P9D1_9PROT|nr:hypothetical protein [Acidisphaera rubrifaciens]GAN78262.1 hypothetical protein Asru_0712_04 [Acidisphaera rubrifaciens HS-AP3]